MNYFVCTYGDFPEQEEMVERSLNEKVYLLHQYARYPSAIDNVDSGDVLLLNRIGHGVVAFAISAGRVSHRSEADEWNHVLATRDGWHKGKKRSIFRIWNIVGDFARRAVLACEKG